MADHHGENWLFTVNSGTAERVYLLKDRIGGMPVWLEMRRVDGQHWQVRDKLQPGSYRFRYYTAEGETLINCGDVGLSASRVDGADPTVRVETADYAARPA